MRNSSSRCTRFFERSLAVGGRMLGGDAGRIIHDGLMRALDANDPCVESTRQPSMCHDGTSVVYSVKVGPETRDSFRVLVEPGSLSDGVARQIAFSLTVVEQLLTRLSWQDAASDINTVTTRVLPGDVAAADRCWGGIWLGASIPRCSDGDRGAELRIYFNLRHGEYQTRWRRVASMLTSLSAEGERDDMMMWVKTASAYTRPVGVALVVAGGRVRGCRIYVVTSMQALPALMAVQQATNGYGIAEFCDAFDQTFGLPQSVTLGYDFENTEGGLRPAVARTKVDLCCQLMDPARKRAVVPWTERLLTCWDMETLALDRFVADLDAEWGRFDVEFVGLGVTGDARHVTIYAKPDFES